MKKITDSIYYIGVNDHKIDLFEGQYEVKNGMSYNSYVIMDEKITILDTVDQAFTHEWLDNIEEALGDKKPSYLIIQHMEPDHSANIQNFIKRYPDVKIVGNEKTFVMIKQFFKNIDIDQMKYEVKNYDVLDLGNHKLVFYFAPMVHWPEVMVTYDIKDEVLFSADGFGKFGALDVEEEWEDEARRYYFGIVGKYGTQVQKLLDAAKDLDISIICPLHGPILKENLGYYLKKYDIWSSYTTENEGIFIAYTSVYGNTKKAVEALEKELKKCGCPKVVVSDLARSDMAKNVENAFRYGRIVLATTTYNMELFPHMNQFIHSLVERNIQNKTIGFIENGTWAPIAAKLMYEKLQNQKNMMFCKSIVKIKSAMNDENVQEISELAKEICYGYKPLDEKDVNKQNMNALFNIGYGLYVVTTNDGKKDNGCIVNTVMQVTSTPYLVAVTVNKMNYSHHVIMQTKKMNVNVLTTSTPFKLIQAFGFQSGRNVDKFAEYTPNYSDNGLAYLSDHINSFMSLDVIEEIDLQTHTMFICNVSESQIVSNKETMTYAYYQSNVKPKPNATKGYVCKVCGYVHEGEELPDGFICPLCKHGPEDFEKIK